MDIMERFARVARAARGADAVKEDGFGRPDALSLLHQDHEDVKQLFDLALEGTATPVARSKVAAKIADALTLHAKVEEKFFYPRVKAASERRSHAREEVLEAVEEHAAIKNAVRRLRSIDARDESQIAKLEVLRELVLHHVREEESTMFPHARSLLDEEELRKVGAQIAAAKKGETPAARRGRARASATVRKRQAR